MMSRSSTLGVPFFPKTVNGLDQGQSLTERHHRRSPEPETVTGAQGQASGVSHSIGFEGPLSEFWGWLTNAPPMGQGWYGQSGRITSGIHQSPPLPEPQ